MNLREYKKASKGMTPEQKINFLKSLSEEDKANLRKSAARTRKRKAMDIAAEMCGLKKVRGSVSGKIYYE